MPLVSQAVCQLYYYPALRALDLSVQQGFFSYPYFATDPLLKAIRDEPECARILEKARQRQYAFKITLQAN